MAKTTFAALMQVPSTFLNKIFSHRHDGLDQDGSAPLDYATTTGTANAYVLTLAPALTQLISGMPIRFMASFTNTGAATLNVNGLGAKSIVKYGDVSLISGNITANQVYTVLYDGTDFHLQEAANADFPTEHNTDGTHKSNVLNMNARHNTDGTHKFNGCLVNNSAPVTCANNTEKLLTWNTEVYDTDNIHNVSTNTSRLTVPAGVTRVRIYAGVSWTPNDVGSRIIYSKMNNSFFVGNPIVRQLATNDSWSNLVSPPLAVAAGDYFELFAIQTSGGNLDTVSGNGAYFAMEIIA